MTYQGSCHCGRVAFEVDGEIGAVVDCNCSMCRRRGGLLWFVPRDALRLTSAVADLGTYTFHTHAIHHHFCPSCGIAPFSESAGGSTGASINVRCLEGVDLMALEVKPYDGMHR